MTTRPRLLSMYAGLRGGPIDDEGEPEEALDEAREALDDPDDPEPIEPAPSAELVALRAEVAELKRRQGFDRREIATLKRRIRFEERSRACTKGDLEIAKRIAGRSAKALKAERLAHRRTRDDLRKAQGELDVVTSDRWWAAKGAQDRPPTLAEIADAIAALGGP